MMNNDSYLPVIVALLPLVAGLLVLQVNPYHALVIRGVLGAIAALIDALLGAADVALTEAMVGTLLAITLYAVAVRSSLVLHLGVIQDHSSEIGHMLEDLRTIFHKWHLRLELVSYKDSQELEQALIAKEVHATCIYSQPMDKEKPIYQTQTRIQRIYDILNNELSRPDVSLDYVRVANLEEKH